MDQDNKTQVVHVNRLKANYNPQTWKPKVKQRPTRKPPQNPTSHLKEEDEIQVGRFPLETEVQLRNKTSPRQTLDTPEPNPQTLDTPESISQTLDTPISERTDPNYEPPETPKSRRELQPTRTEPPFTRSRARAVSQESMNE